MRKKVGDRGLRCSPGEFIGIEWHLYTGRQQDHIMSFRGRFDHTLDTKGRGSVPAGFRMEIQRLGGDAAPILTRGKNHLVLYPAETWAGIEEDRAAKSSLRPKGRDYQ